MFNAICVYLHEFRFVTVLFRLVLAMIAGGVIGYGRAKKKRAAGFRTYMLASIGAALAIMLSIYEYEQKEALDKVMRYCKDNRLVINNLQVIHGESTQEAYVARISLSAIHQVHPHELQLKIQTMEGIRHVEMVDQGE